MRTKADREREGFSCKWTSLSVWSLQERRRHLKVIFHDLPVLKIENKEANEKKVQCVGIIQRGLCFHSFCSSLFVRTDRGRGLLRKMQNV